jgi:N-acetylglucosamine kinase-like BadF-type ATPase
MTGNKYFILIDTGGTNCKIAAGDITGKIVNPELYPSVHFSKKGLSEFCRHISDVIEKYTAGNQLDSSQFAGICIGAAGARDKIHKDSISDEIRRITGARNVFTESDTSIAYESYFGTDDGLLLICGTGSVLFGKYLGSDVRIGGWGSLLGDAGSSYSLSLNILRELVKEFDRNEKKSELELLLEKEYGLSRHTIINLIYHGNFDIAGLTPFFMRLAGIGNELCKKAADAEIEGITEMIKTFLIKYEVENPVRIAFTGSLVETKNYFSDGLFESFGNNFNKKVKTINEFKNPLEGALKIALRRITG